MPISSFKPRTYPTLVDYNPGSGPSKDEFKWLHYSIKVSNWLSNKTRSMDTNLSKEIGIIAMNLVSCVKKNKYLCYSRNTRCTKKNRYNKKGIDNRRVIKAIDKLEELGYCTNYIASSKQNPKKERMYSFIQPSQQFIDELFSADEMLVFDEQQHALDPNK